MNGRGIKLSKSQKYIGVYIENKYYFLVSFCGIILSGNIIVPLNVSDGIERTKRIITDCKIDTIITEKSLIDIVKKFNYTKKVVVMDDKNNFLRKEQNKVIIPFDASNIGTFYSKEREIKDSIKNYLYAVYTSGSTGKPKGIKVNSHNVMHLFEWIKKNFCISEKTVSYQHLSLSFDFGLKEIFNVIMNGGKLVLGTKEEKYSPQKMLEKINNKKVNMLYTTPTMFKELVSIKKKLSTLKLICLGGEALEYSILQNSKFFLNNGVSIFNGYVLLKQVLMH
jgi:acyl-CoA synthetase (AMP-forming)/AMP-acid ligase II